MSGGERKFGFLLIVAGVTFFVYHSFWNSPQQQTVGARATRTVANKPIVKKINLKKLKNRSAKQSVGEVAQDELPHFSFEDQRQEVEKLAREWPSSRERLLQIISQEDPFKASGKKVKPHSKAEWMQNKMGAIKVMALRELMKKQTSMEDLYKDLGAIQRQANDPVIRQIAKAARDSMKENRSFFDDFLDGVSRLPTPDETEEL